MSRAGREIISNEVVGAAEPVLERHESALLERYLSERTSVVATELAAGVVARGNADGTEWLVSLSHRGEKLSPSLLRDVQATLSDRGFATAALAVAKANVKANSESFVAHQGLGDALASSGDRDAALSAYQEAHRRLDKTSIKPEAAKARFRKRLDAKLSRLHRLHSFDREAR